MEKSPEVPESLAKEAPGRKDRGCLHAVRGSVLSRGLLHSLQRLGENVRTLRRMESGLRADLKPKGALGQLIFDQFWASVLRLILVARLEEAGLTPQGSTSKTSVSVPFLTEGAVPTLVVPTEDEKFEHDQEERNFGLDVFRRLALLSPYCRAASREMRLARNLLELMRDRGKTGLESWARTTVKIKPEEREEDKSA
jgi:hypothetical protein